MTALHLDAESVEAVARRVTELLREGGLAGQAELVDTAEVARRFGVSRDYLYTHAEDLGAVRLGSGPKARLRFDPERVRETLAARPQEPSHPVSRPPRRTGRRSNVAELLPVRGSRA